MRVLLAGPCATAAFRQGLGVVLPGAPDGELQTPIGPVAIEFVKRGHDVHVVTLDASVDAPIRYSYPRFSISYLPMRGHFRERALDLYSKEARAVAEEVRMIGPDVVHAHWTYEYAEAGLRSRLPLLVTAHDSPVDNILAFRRPWLLVRLVMAIRVLARVRHLTCVAPFLRSRLRALGYWRKIDVVPNGVDVEDFSMLPDASSRLAEPIIVSIGNDSRAKNVAASIAAFREIKRTCPTAELHLFGDGLNAGFAAGEPGVIGHGLVDHPTILDVLRSQASLLIHPSRLEACPVAIIEAMAAGVPCVAGLRAGGVPSLFSACLSDCLVDIEDPIAIATRAIQILTSDAEWLRLSRAGRDNVIANFSIQQVASRYEALYHDLAASRRLLKQTI
jgi:L-malate glycosyltransferase